MTTKATLVVVSTLLLGACFRTGYQPHLPDEDSGSNEASAVDALVDAGDGQVLDSGRPDLPGDAPQTKDTSPPDLPLDVPSLPDLPVPDLPSLPDLPVPDLPVPDQFVPDLPVPDLFVPDLPVPDQFVPDLFVPDQLVPDLPPPDTGCVLVGWWDTSYGYRRTLTIQETASGALPQGYSVVIVLDTQALVSAGKMLASGDDLRVVRQGVELDRRVVAPDTTATEIWFKTQTAIDTSDATYEIYYGNPTAGAPPAHWSDSMGTDAVGSKVYLAADSFEDDAVGTLPGGWDGSSKYSVAQDGTNRVLEIDGTSPNADYLFAGDCGWTDVVVQARLRVIDTSGDHYGLFTRAESLTNFDALWFGLQSNNTLALYTTHLTSSSATGLASASSKGSWFLSPPAGSSWHTIEMRLLGQKAEVVFDGVTKTTYNILPNQMTSGRIGLCAGYPASEAHWDDMVVRLYVKPEPTVNSAVEESGCP